MKHVKKLIINEDIFNVKELDYIDSFTEIFEVFSFLIRKSYIDKEGSLLRKLDDINDEIERVFDIDEYFDSIEHYYSQFKLVSDIIKIYKNRI